MNVKELSGSTLDEWVARAEGFTILDGVESLFIVAVLHAGKG